LLFGSADHRGQGVNAARAASFSRIAFCIEGEIEFHVVIPHLDILLQRAGLPVVGHDSIPPRRQSWKMMKARTRKAPASTAKGTASHQDTPTLRYIKYHKAA